MRKTGRGIPLYNDADDSDIFILAGQEDLVPLLEQDTMGIWVSQNLPTRTEDGAQFEFGDIGREWRDASRGLSFGRILTPESSLADIFEGERNYALWS